MSKIGWKLHCALIVLTVGLMSLATAPATAQTTDQSQSRDQTRDQTTEQSKQSDQTTERSQLRDQTMDQSQLRDQAAERSQLRDQTRDQTTEQSQLRDRTMERLQLKEEDGTAGTANPPAYIDELMEATGIEKVRVDAMREDGLGWGEIRIATLLAQKISAGSEGELDLNAALEQVLAARADGKGFGEIAAENNLNVGELLRDDGKGAGDTGVASAGNQSGKGSASAAGAKEEKKLGFLARLGRFLGFGKSTKNAEQTGVERKLQEGSARTVRGDRPERPVRAERTIRVERPERPEAPARIERPERPEKGPHGG